MNRRTILFALAAVMALPVAAATAKEPYEEWIDWLEDAGYSDITATRTFLGRIQIQARLGRMNREIVINPRTGEVLRDVMLDASGAVSSPNGPPSLSGSSGRDGNSGHGSNDSLGGGDDHGGNSGHGGGSDDSGSDDHGGHGGGHGSDD